LRPRCCCRCSRTRRPCRSGTAGGLEPVVTGNLAADVPSDPPQIDPQLPQHPVGTLELFGVRVALMLHQGELADPRKGLPQPDAMLLGQPHQPYQGAVHQPGISRECDRLWLHRGIDDDVGEVGWLGGIRAHRHVQALLEQSRKLLLTHALTPARHRGRSNTSLCWKNSSPQNS
jgi:hypothetical protein